MLLIHPHKWAAVPYRTAEATNLELRQVIADVQLLLSFPVTPFTYHVVAQAVDAKPRTPASSSRVRFNLMTIPPRSIYRLFTILREESFCVESYDGRERCAIGEDDRRENLAGLRHIVEK
jgi:hypothetical protein